MLEKNFKRSENINCSAIALMREFHIKQIHSIKYLINICQYLFELKNIHMKVANNKFVDLGEIFSIVFIHFEFIKSLSFECL